MPHLKATSRGTVSLSASICGFGISSIGLPIFHLHVISPSCNFCILSLYIFFAISVLIIMQLVRLSAMHLALLNLIHRSIQHQIYRCDPWNFHIAQRMSNPEESLVFGSWRSWYLLDHLDLVQYELISSLLSLLAKVPPAISDTWQEPQLLLCQGKRIVVDRCNVTRLQRRVWLGVADENKAQMRPNTIRNIRNKDS